MAFLIIYLFILGLLIGSFLNVVILRYNTGKSLSGRSGCFSCRHKLAWYELVPVLSFLVQRGRCRHCGSKISRQYPTVELLTGVLFAVSAWKFYPNLLVIGFYCLIMALLVVVVVYDLRHKIIADGPTYTFIILSVFAPVITAWASGRSGLETGWALLVNLVAGFILFTAFFCLWYFSGGRWMGFGDAKLAFGIGALLGLSGGINAIVMAFWLGAVIGLFLIALGRLGRAKRFRHRFSIKSEMPFAPFLALGLLLNLFFGLTVLLY